jgi:hypothetical protein
MHYNSHIVSFGHLSLLTKPLIVAFPGDNLKICTFRAPHIHGLIVRDTETSYIGQKLKFSNMLVGTKKAVWDLEAFFGVRFKFANQ